MDEKGKYLAGIVVLILGVLLYGAFASWYDDRDRTLAREDNPPGDIKITRTESNGFLPARIFTGTRTSVSEETTFVVQEQNLNSAARAARNSLAARLGISTNSVVVTSIESRDWPNSCLGLERSGEFCAQAIFSGYRVVMQAQGNTYSYRTNLDGSLLRGEN